MLGLQYAQMPISYGLKIPPQLVKFQNGVRVCVGGNARTPSIIVSLSSQESIPSLHFGS